jgi:hypothetical protein
MNCKKVQTKLLEYLNNELPDKINQLLENHIKSCPDCQKELEGLKKTMNLFDQLPQVELEPEQQDKFLYEVRQKIRQQTQVRPVRYRWKWLLPRLVPALAAASILVVFVVMRLKSSDKKYAEMAANIFTSPSLSISGEFVYDYFKTNGNGNALNEELSQLSSNVIDEIESYLANQLEVSDMVEDMTDDEKTRLVKKIEEML